MGNWITFLLVNVVLAFIVGVLGNFASPWIKSYFEKGSLSMRERRLFLLQKRYKNVKELNEFPMLMIDEALRFVISSIAAGAFMVITTGLFFVLVLYPSHPGLKISSTEVIYYLLGLLGISSIYQSIVIRDSIGDAVRFEKYKEKTIKKYRKLGGNPEDLDEEENE